MTSRGIIHVYCQGLLSTNRESSIQSHPNTPTEHEQMSMDDITLYRSHCQKCGGSTEYFDKILRPLNDELISLHATLSIDKAVWQRIWDTFNAKVAYEVSFSLQCIFKSIQANQNRSFIFFTRIYKKLQEIYLEQYSPWARRVLITLEWDKIWPNAFWFRGHLKVKNQFLTNFWCSLQCLRRYGISRIRNTMIYGVGVRLI